MWSLSANDTKRRSLNCFCWNSFISFLRFWLSNEYKKFFFFAVFFLYLKNFFLSRVHFASAKRRRINAICTSQKLIWYVYYVLNSERAIREQKKSQTTIQKRGENWQIKCFLMGEKRSERRARGNLLRDKFAKSEKTTFAFASRVFRELLSF